jgi:hypothetical protein
VQAPERVIGDTLEDVGEPSLRVDVVQLRRADHGVHGRRALPATIRAAEQPRFSPQGHAAQRSFRGVVREADPPVIEEAGEGRPALEQVVHRLGDLGLPRQPRALVAQPSLEVHDQGGHVLAPVGEPLLGGLAVDDTLVGEQGVDPADRLEGQRGRCLARAGEVSQLEEQPAGMRPTRRLGDGAACGWRPPSRRRAALAVKRAGAAAVGKDEDIAVGAGKGARIRFPNPKDEGGVRSTGRAAEPHLAGNGTWASVSRSTHGGGSDASLRRPA